MLQTNWIFGIRSDAPTIGLAVKDDAS